MESKKDIYSFWIHYTTKNEEIYFRKFISGLVSIWESQLNLDWTNDDTLPESESITPDQGPHLSRLPEELLPAIGKFLYVTKDKTDKEELTSEELKEAGLLVRTLILISRNFNNISSVAASDYVHLIIGIASNIMSKIVKDNLKSNKEEGIQFCIQCCHLLECLYDPYFAWRYFKRTNKLTQSTQHYKTPSAAFLHIEVVPFIFEYFEQKISKSIPLLAFELLNVLGAVVSGSQDIITDENNVETMCNALTGVCPATASLLVTIISDSGASIEIRIIAIKCFIIMMHTLLSIEPHQRQIEISTLLELYRGCITNVISNADKVLSEEKIISMLSTMVDMLSVLIDVSDGDNRKLVRCIMVQNFILECVLDALEKVEADNKLTTSCIKTLANIIKNGDFSKERMIKIDGYTRVFRKIKLVENIDISLLTVLVEMAIEEKYEMNKSYKLQNSKVIVPLLQLIPSLEAQSQEWLTSVIFSICSCNLQCKWKAIKCGSIKAACESLRKYKTLAPGTIHLLINLMENLASISINTAELKNIFNLLLVSDNKLCPYYLNILQVISNITRANSFINCKSYFDIQSTADGISVPDIKKWPDSIFGFSFHCWLSLNKIDNTLNMQGTSSYRRQIFTLLTAAKQGVEIHISAENCLVIIINTKKEFIAVSLFDFTFEENRWYCLDVTYVPAKRPFAQNQICIFIDGIQQLVATAKFAHIPEAFTWCRIGAPIDDVDFENDSSNNTNPSSHHHERSIIPSFISQVPSYITFPLRSSSNVNPYVKNFPVGMQTTIFGPTIALYGQLGNICLFQEPLTSQNIKLLYETGINSEVLFNVEDNIELANLNSKLVFSFSPSACAFDHAIDLCSKYKLDGRTTAVICIIHSLKESVNTIGGVNVFLPFYETVDYTADDTNITGQGISVEDYSDMTDFAITNFRNVSEVQLEENSVAAVIIIIKNLLKDPVSQEYFLKRHGFAMLGKLLSEVSPNLMDVPVLISVCMLSEAVNNCKNSLFQRTYYQNVLFNFDIWSRCNYEVQQGHVQYLYSFVKKDKKFFKKRFGVQFFLDVIRMHASNNDLTNSDALKAVRVTIIGIINYYIQKELSVQELQAIIGYVVACGNEVQIIEVLDMIMNHLMNKSCTDQLYLLLYEQHCADLFYSFLVDPCFGEDLKKVVLRLFSVLLRTDRVYERSKLRLQLQDYTPMGLYPGLVAAFPTDQNLSIETALLLLDQILMSETSGGFTGALVLLCRLSLASLDIKLEAARKILAVVFMKPSAPVMFAKQIGWQDSIARLLIHHPIKHQEFTSPTEVMDFEKLPVSKDNKSSEKNYPSILKDVTSFLADSDIKDATESVSSLVTDNIQYAANNITSAAENVTSLVAENIHFAASNLTSAAENVSFLVSENIQFAADSLTSVAENVTSAVTDNINFAAENISSVVGSAYSLITQKASSFERNEHTQTDELKAPAQNEDFTLINFDDLSLSNRSYSNGSIDEISVSNRSHSSQSKFSPSHTSKDSISLTSMQSGSNDSDIFEDNDEERVIFDMLEQWRNLESEKEEDKEQELCNAVVNILFTIMWKGYDAHQKLIWKERGQVMACINMIGLNNALYCSHLELKLKVLEMMLQAALVDLIDSTHTVDTLAVRTENASQLLRWVYDLIVADPSRNDSKHISIKLLDGVVGLLDVLLIFRENPAEETPELVKASFAILLKSAANKNTELCAMAAAKLHTVIQTRKMSVVEEGCYILFLLSDIIVRDVQEENMEHYSFMVPVMKTLLGKLSEVLPICESLTDLNVTNPGSGFYEKFQKFCLQEKWNEFLEKEVKSHYDRYKNSLATDLTEVMNVFWAECYEAYKINSHKKNKMVAESKERFEDVIYKPYLARKEEDNIRFNNVLNQYRNHRILLRKKWKVQKNYLIGPRRAWKDSPKEVHWRLSHHENFSRMRLKLIPNLHFDSHKDASNLRDNTGWSKIRMSEEIALPLNISQVALRQEADFSIEQTSEAELIVNKLEESEELENKSDIALGTEKLLIACDCELVTLMSVIKGKIEITTNNFYFYDLSQIKEDGDRHDFKWSINKLREIYLRRYNLRKTALEFFLTDQTNYFLNFNKEVRNNVFTTLMRLRPPNLLFHSYKSPSDLLRSSGLMQKWVNREITNFDYLMQLNTIAGRTYNDLSQYPVFPWILADYESEELDLTNPSTFRDLSRPVGVVNPLNEAEVRSKYNTFEDPCGVIAKFHYGTHYSNSAGVLHYLVRVEPFTTLHIELQSGRFDVADRQFHSIPQTWKLLMENPNDVKELIPEFFYFPEFLKNINKFDLGVLQGTKEKVDDVILPKWASNPEDFIYKHRKALESEYVSSHLHEWIDLIFGYKQRGPHAIKALNVFYYCSYEGAVDLDAIEDPTEREAVEGMINNFGQTPSQLLKEPHPQRLSLNDALLKMIKTDFKKPDLTLFFDQLTHFQIEMASDRDPIIFLSSPRSMPRGFLMSSVSDALITVSRSGCIGMHSWTPHDRYSAKGFSIVVDESVNNTKWRRDLSGSFHPSIKLHNKLFVVSHDSKFLFSAGHWDYTIKIYSFTKNKFTYSLQRHTDLVTCLAGDSCGWYLISGSKDCTVIVWDINAISVTSPRPYQLLHGHDEPITCVAISTELDMAVSGSQDGTVNVYTIHEGHLVHTLSPEGCVSPIADVTFVTISVQGQIAFSVTDKVNHSIHVYSINGVNLGSKYVLGQVTSLTTVNDCVVVTDDAGDLTISRLLGLHPMFNIPLHIPIQTAVSTSGNTHLLVPLRDGHLVVIGLPNN